MNRFRFYIGTNKKNGKPVTQEDWRYCEDYLLSRYGGFSQYSVKGAWKNDNGDVIKESSKVYEVITDCTVSNGAVLACYAEQESVLVTRDTVDATFYD